MYKLEQNYGIVFITGRSCEFYKIIKSGEHLEIKKLYEENVSLPNKHNKGGQSAPRFQRLHEEKEDAYINQVSQEIIQYFMKNNNTKYTIEKLIIAGPGDKKKLIVNHPLVLQYFKNKLHIMNTADLNEKNIIETIYSMKELFEEDLDKYYDKFVDEINELMILDIDKLLFGLEEIMDALDKKQIHKIIMTDNYDIPLMYDKCELIKLPSYKLKQIGLDIVGIKFY